MVYSNQLVAVVKCSGKIMREKKGDIFLPFGSEYSILIKNLNSRKALVNVWIDGQSLFTLGSGLVVGPNSEVELERFYKTNNRFKFIEKTEEISKYRGDRIDDGLIRVEFQFEREHVTIPIVDWNKIYTDIPDHWWDKDPHPYEAKIGDFPQYDNKVTSDIKEILCTDNCLPRDCSYTTCNDSGITVKGSRSNQEFTSGYIGELELNKHVIILNLKGFTSREEKIDKPITVTDKIRCETCGKVCNSKQNYCDRCGTALF